MTRPSEETFWTWENWLTGDGLESIMDLQGLLNEAIKARNGSYSPYSKFSVGAAILTENGNIYTGANVENASFGLTICAERAAAVKAVNEGQRKFLAVACVGG